MASTGSRLPRKLLTLKQFMLRQQVLSLYRDVLRTSRAADPAQREEIISWARADFRQNKNVEDEVVIKMLLSNGKQMIKQLKASLNKFS